eukprot:991896-Amphidinium_carterae.3
MSPKRTSKDQAMIQDYNAVRGQRLSPRAGSVKPYSTPVDRPQALGVRDTHRTRQWQKSHEDATEIAVLTARLGCAESNMQDLEKFAEHEHNVAKCILTEGRQFYVYVEQQARGFSQAESNAARSNADIELRRYRQADVVRQQHLLGNLERQMEQANKEALDQHRLTVGERYRTEFVAKLSSVQQQIEMMEVLCERQRRAIDNRRLEELIAVAEDRSRQQEHHSNQLEQRLKQVSEMHDASLAEVLAEMEELEALSTPRFNKIDTPEFGVQFLKTAVDGQTTPTQTQTASFPNPAGSCKDCGHANVPAPPPGLGSPKPSAGMPYQTPSAAAASPLSGTGGGNGSTHPRPGTNQGHGYESFGEQTNNSQNPPDLNAKEAKEEREEIFQILTTMTITTMMKMTTTAQESMNIDMSKCLVGVTYAGRRSLHSKDMFVV